MFRFALRKLFYECKKIEEIDVSHFLNIGDDELRVLSLNCPNLTILNAKESDFISDQGVLAISQGCPDLDYIDISRQRYNYRITDVSLLALGQRSKSLRVLIANGCDHISDVGLQWLSEGCKVLEELLLYGCDKVITIIP